SAQHRVAEDSPGKAKAREKITVNVRNKVLGRAIAARELDLSRIPSSAVSERGIKTRELVVRFRIGTVKLPANPQVQGEPGADFIIVLQIHPRAVDIETKGVVVDVDRGRGRHPE